MSVGEGVKEVFEAVQSLDGGGGVVHGRRQSPHDDVGQQPERQQRVLFEGPLRAGDQGVQDRLVCQRWAVDLGEGRAVAQDCSGDRVQHDDRVAVTGCRDHLVHVDLLEHCRAALPGDGAGRYGQLQGWSGLVVRLRVEVLQDRAAAFGDGQEHRCELDGGECLQLQATHHRQDREQQQSGQYRDHDRDLVAGTDGQRGGDAEDGHADGGGEGTPHDGGLAEQGQARRETGVGPLHHQEQQREDDRGHAQDTEPQGEQHGGDLMGGQLRAPGDPRQQQPERQAEDGEEQLGAVGAGAVAAP